MWACKAVRHGVLYLLVQTLQEVIISVSEKGCQRVHNDLYVHNINTISSHIVSSRKLRYQFWKFLIHPPSHFIFAPHGGYGKIHRGGAHLKCCCNIKNMLPFTCWLHIAMVSDSSEDACLILTFDGLVTHLSG